MCMYTWSGIRPNTRRNNGIIKLEIIKGSYEVSSNQWDIYCLPGCWSKRGCCLPENAGGGSCFPARSGKLKRRALQWTNEKSWRRWNGKESCVWARIFSFFLSLTVCVRERESVCARVCVLTSHCLVLIRFAVFCSNSQRHYSLCVFDVRRWLCLIIVG